MWFAREYDPIQVGSIDGTDTTPHDRALLRAITSRYHPPGKTRPELTRDPLKTLFVGRLDPETTEDKLRDAFISFGDIINAVIVSNFVTGDSRGYGFVEFSSETDCEKAYRRSQHLSIDGRTVIVDYERGRIMEGWRPRRVGGGFGGRKESSQLRFGARDRPFRQPILGVDKDDTMQQRLVEVAKMAKHQRYDDCWRTAYLEKERRQRQRSPSSSTRSRSYHHDRHRRDSVSPHQSRTSRQVPTSSSSSKVDDTHRMERRHRSRSPSSRRHHYHHRSHDYYERHTHQRETSHRRDHSESNRRINNEHDESSTHSRHRDRDRDRYHHSRRSRSPSYRTHHRR